MNEAFAGCLCLPEMVSSFPQPAQLYLLTDHVLQHTLDRHKAEGGREKKTKMEQCGVRLLKKSQIGEDGNVFVDGKTRQKTERFEMHRKSWQT